MLIKNVMDGQNCCEKYCLAVAFHGVKIMSINRNQYTLGSEKLTFYFIFTQFFLEHDVQFL